MDLVFKAELLSGQKTDCPCCGRYAQVYKRHINCTIARQLIMLHKKADRNYLHASLLIPSGQTGQGDLTKAKYFKLIEAMPEESEVKKSSGFWRLTEKGLGFIKGEILIPEYVLIFDDNVIGVSETHIDIKQSLASGGFNYSDLMEYGF